MHSEGPHAGPQGTFRHLNILAYDTPETDSHIKQLGAHVGDIANHPHVFISKEGQTGTAPWVISNRNYDATQMAHPEAIQFPIAEDPGVNQGLPDTQM